MGYAFAVSFSRSVMTLLFAAIGSLTLAMVIGTRYGALPAAFVAAVFATACGLGWRADRQRQPHAIRLMGGRDAILYFPTRAPLARVLSAFPVVCARAVPPMAVRIDRVLHWPGRLLGIVVTPQRPSGRPFAVLILPDSLPYARFRALAAQLRCVQRGVTLIEHH